MDTLSAFMRGDLARLRGNPQRVFDWDKAAEILKERNPEYAMAGLFEDWGWTCGEIWSGGEPVLEEDTYTYLSSNWATPMLYMDGEYIECWLFGQDTEYDADTYWPESALEILRQQEEPDADL